MARTKVFPSGSDYDDFNRAGAGSSPDLGANYTDDVTAWGRVLIASSLYAGSATASWVISGEPTFYSYIDATAGTFSADQYVDAAIVSLGTPSATTELALAVRTQGTGDFICYFVRVTDGSSTDLTLRFGKMSAGGAETWLDGGSKTVAWSSGDRLGIEVTGSSPSDPVLVITKNGSQIYTGTDTSGTRIYTGRPGLSVSGTLTTNRRVIDDLQAGDITSGSTGIAPASRLSLLGVG